MPDAILFFHRDRHAYPWLSNFYPSPLCSPRGRVYPTLEHAFQACKTSDSVEHERIRIASTPAQAKRLGRRVQLDPDWNDRRLDVMAMLLAVKFAPGSDLAARLIATGQAFLVEDSPYDRYWGAGSDGTGLNWLGVLLMQLRSKLTASSVPCSAEVAEWASRPEEAF